MEACMRRILTLIKNPPRIPELLFAAVLIWMFATGQGWTVLLADGDTGWHIRNGEQIIDTRTVPYSDAFAFGSAGRPWFSWEWLSDVMFAALFRGGGLKAVSVFCGIVIAASISILFRHMAWRSVGSCIALPLTFLTVGASSVHYLARPHAIGLLFFAITGWVIDKTRTSPMLLVWTLPVLFLLWANCHGSFLAGLAMLALWVAEGAAAKRMLQPAVVFAASTAATFGNPYGWHLHAHAIAYLESTWIQATVEEFQSPRFRSENMLHYEILLILGLSALPWLLRRRQFYPVGVILLWAHESLSSVRHVPLYGLAATPFIASWLQLNWDRALRRRRAVSFVEALNSINTTWQPWTRGVTVWPALLCLAIGSAALSGDRAGFPVNKFPVNLVDRDLSLLAGRVFSSDQWSDYLIFRLYPKVRIFFDGRSDFFGSWRGVAYQQLMAGSPDSATILDNEGVDTALLPADWSLSGILRESSQWQMVDSDGQAVLFIRTAGKSTICPNQNLAVRR
jgi:hypothetical protein